MSKRHLIRIGSGAPSRAGWLLSCVFVLLAVLPAGLGCGGSKGSGAHVAGKVTLGGKDLPSDAEAFITFAAAGAATQEQPVTVPITASRYDSPSTPTGKVKAYIAISRKTGPVKKSERTGAEYQDVVNLVPPQYSTGIEIDVAGDNRDQDFEL
jgi:hypothetical protein